MSAGRDGSVLDGIAALGSLFAVCSHPPGATPMLPWRRFSEVTDQPGRLSDRVASVRAALAVQTGRAVGEVELRVAASTAHFGLVTQLISPAVGAVVLGCPIDMRPGGLWWRDEAGDARPLSVPVPDYGHDPVAPRWDRWFLDEVIAPVTSATARLARVSGRVLWRIVASAVNAAAGRLAGQRPDLASEAWQAAAALFASPSLRRERQLPGPAFRRSSRRLYYRLTPGAPSAFCGDRVLGGPRGR